MSAPLISQAMNGIRGGKSHRGRGHKRNHGNSVNDALPQVLPYTGGTIPPQDAHAPVYSSNITKEETSTQYLENQGPGLMNTLNGRANWDGYHGHGYTASHDELSFGNASSSNVHMQTTLKQRVPRSASSQGLGQQIISGLLTAMPFVMSHLLAEPIHLGSAKGETQSTKASHSLRFAGIPLVVSCAYVSVALLVHGIYEKIRQARVKGNAGATDGNRSSLYDGTRTAIWMILPLYASFMIGFDVVIAVLLLNISTDSRTSSSGNTLTRTMRILKRRKVSALFIVSMAILDIAYISSAHPLDAFKGYTAIAATIMLPSPGSHLTLADTAVDEKFASRKDNIDDTATVNLVIGTVLGALILFVVLFSGGFSAVPLSSLPIFVVGLFTAASQLIYGIDATGRPSLPSIVSGAIIAVIAMFVTSQTHIIPLQATRFGLACLASFADSKIVHKDNHSQEKTEKKPSRMTLWLLGACEQWPFIHAILKERDSRRIFYFMNLNLTFMVVQLTYGVVTGSLGLLSDSIHMLFDCFALAVGLAAAVMSKWPPSSRFPYGYGKIDTLAGFGNGVFLMIISVEIIYEAVERLMSGSEVHRIGDLFVVSSLGLVVNMVGIFAFDHAHHGHGHAGHDHDHGHGNENMHGIFLHILADALGSVAVVSSTVLVHFFGWSGFDPIASCLIAILIFVSAIPLVISTSKTLLLALPADVEYSLRDTLAGVSVMRGVVGYTVPKFWLDDTVHDHNHKHHSHSHSHDHDHDHGHTHTHNSHKHNHGGSHCSSHHSYNSHSDNHSHTHSHAHGHTKCSSHSHSHGPGDDHGNRRVLGVIHIIASKNADLSDVHTRVANYLSEKGMNVLIQVEREGDGKCWCGGGK
ncbi:CDF zinc transporter [Trichophyton equinum CBS 127.97]|uniref:Zinc transporter n=1 Tax=Trichophyton equinum (strain ATCC MYA-4606 / CBS 127.97) TaxID=559882 RepID=F2PYF2_TRIEC|nr:CDF zinc transporter [Trichophyton equinum CBS 127.97]